jgi:hypothetical protein
MMPRARRHQVIQHTHSAPKLPKNVSISDVTSDNVAKYGSCQYLRSWLYTAEEFLGGGTAVQAFQDTTELALHCRGSAAARAASADSPGLDTNWD